MRPMLDFNFGLSKTLISESGYCAIIKEQTETETNKNEKRHQSPNKQIQNKKRTKKIRMNGKLLHRQREISNIFLFFLALV